MIRLVIWFLIIATILSYVLPQSAIQKIPFGPEFRQYRIQIVSYIYRVADDAIKDAFHKSISEYWTELLRIMQGGAPNMKQGIKDTLKEGVNNKIDETFEAALP